MVENLTPQPTLEGTEQVVAVALWAELEELEFSQMAGHQGQGSFLTRVVAVVDLQVTEQMLALMDLQELEVQELQARYLGRQ